MADSEIAKTQLREHLATLLISPISDGFWSIQTAASELCTRNGTPDQVIRTFQNMLTKIPEWSDVTLRTEVERWLFLFQIASHPTQLPAARYAGIRRR